jgi:hypothetical protein
MSMSPDTGVSSQSHRACLSVHSVHNHFGLLVLPLDDSRLSGCILFAGNCIASRKSGADGEKYGCRCGWDFWVWPRLAWIVELHDFS